MAGRYRLVLTARGVVTLLAGAVVAFSVVGALERSGAVLTLLGAAMTAAVVIAPTVDTVSRRVPRAVALVTVTLIGITGVLAAFATLAWDLNRQARVLTAALHRAIAQLDPAGRPARLADELELQRRVDEVFDGAAARLVVGDTRPLTALALVGTTVLIAVMAAFMIASGPGVFAAVVRFARRASIREQIHTTTRHAVHRAGAYLRRTMTVSAVHGATAAAGAHLAGLPGSISLGAWVAAAVTVPVLGAPLAWAPVITVAVANHRPLTLLLTTAVLAVFVDRWLRARWVHRALHVGPVLGLGGLAVGHQLIGVTGALVGLLAVAVVAAVVDEPHQIAGAVTDLVEDPPPATPSDGGHTDRDAHPTPVVMMADAAGGTAAVLVEPSPRSTATVVAVVAAVTALGTVMASVRAQLIWFAVGAFVAIGLDRAVTFAHRRARMPRIVAIHVVLSLLVIVVAAVVVVAGPSITDSAATIARDAPATVESLESLPFVGPTLARHGAAERVERWLSALPDQLVATDAAGRAVRAAGDGLLGAGWILAMALAILWDGPRLVMAAQRRIPLDRRQRAVRFGRAAHTALSNVVAAALFVATLNGTIVMLLAIAFGIPLAPLLGLWAMVWNLIPQIGGFVGALPLVALGLGQGPLTGIIVLVVFVAYQTFENHVLQPFIGSRVVRLPPLVVLAGALLGAALVGVVGALLAGPVLGVAKVAIDEFTDRTRVDDRDADGGPIAGVRPA